MSPASELQLAQAVHASGRRLVVAVTGGGSRAISALVSTPGASRSILAATVPYSAEALADWLGHTPEHYCAQPTARAMAMAGFVKAQAYDPAAEHPVGVSCTASLASNRPKRGEHRASFAYQTPSTTAVFSLVLEKGRRTRDEEESLIAGVLLNIVAEACGLEARVDVQLAAGEQLDAKRITASRRRQELLAGSRQLIPLEAAAHEPPRAVLSGAFNPLHEGHRRMAEIAAGILGARVAFEISIANVDKLPLDFIDVDERSRQFAAEQNLFLSRAPTFVEKARLFPGATFVVGADTMERIGQPRYYGGQPAAMQAALAEIAAPAADSWYSAARRMGAFVHWPISSCHKRCENWPTRCPKRPFGPTFPRPNCGGTPAANRAAAGWRFHGAICLTLTGRAVKMTRITRVDARVPPRPHRPIRQPVPANRLLWRSIMLRPLCFAFAAATALVVLAGTARAADPNGTWKWTLTGPNGQEFQASATLKQEGDKLTGKVTRGEMSTDISDGTFKDDEVAFTVMRERNGQKFTAKYKGKVEGDALKGKIDIKFGDNERSVDWNATREKK